MAGPIAKEISEEYNISPKESASLLDTFSCVFQGVIPYACLKRALEPVFISENAG